MPQKPNRSGQLQNYVPAGNGDASGEYGDNESGSNKHFTSFKRPDEKQETTEKETIVETPKEETKSRLSELSKKQRKELGKYAYGKDIDNMEDYQKENFVRMMRWYAGDELKGFTDDEVLAIGKEFANATEKSDKFVYFKEGGKWKLTKNIGLLQKQDIPYYTQEQYEELENKTNEKLFTSSQTDSDKKIQSIYGEGTIVCFGKGYSPEDMKEIEEASQVLVDEYPDLKGYVKEIGDRNNLEKYINAINSQKQFTEEEIKAQIEKEKQRYFFGTPSDEQLRATAINRLRGNVKLDKMNRAFAYWSGTNKRMVFQGKMKKDQTQEMKSEYEMNWHPSDKVISIYYHEMGHAVDYLTQDMEKNKYKQLKQDFASGKISFEKLKEFERIKSDFVSQLHDLKMQNYNGENYSKEIVNRYNKKYNTDYESLRDLERHYSHEVYQEIDNIKEQLKQEGYKKYNLCEYGATNDTEFIAESFAAYYTNMNNPLANKMVGAIKDYYKKLKEFK